MSSYQYQCDCGLEANWEKRDGAFWMTCERKHSVKLNFCDVEMALRKEGLNVDAMLDAPERAAQKVFKRKGLPDCLGSFSAYYPIRRPSDFASLPDADDPESAFAKVLDDLVKRATGQAIYVANCARCSVFDRCKAMSPTVDA